MDFLKRMPLFLKILIIGFFTIITLIFTVLSVVTAWISIPPVHQFQWIKTLITNLATYGNIFTITLGIFALIYVVQQLNEAAVANKISNKLRWTDSLKEVLGGDRYKPIKYAMIREYFVSKHKSDEIFEFLFDNNSSLKVRNKSEVEAFFTYFLKDKIPAFEDFPKDEPKGTDIVVYFEDVYLLVSEIVFTILEPSSKYRTLHKDFEELYLSSSKLKEIKS